ncbi:MAG: hypothetical protein QGD90_03315 [Candidatus Hydrogenedentes bacterium]|nr:hypothetical protein [Candidatus Hydrogenedentota bacterium]
MGDTLNQSDVARILKVQEASVRRLFEEGALSGMQSDEEWHTTQGILAADLAVLTEDTRVQRLKEGKYISPWAAGLKEGDPGHISSERIAAIIEGCDADAAQH